MTTSTNAELLNASCSYWSLTEEEQLAVAASVPDQDTWVLDVRRNKDGTWEFDLPEFRTYSELLVGGTEQCLDFHYNNLSETAADEHSTIKLTVSRNPLENETTSCIFEKPDKQFAGASFYLDLGAKQQMWLCPYLSVLFKSAPPTLYVRVEVTS